MKTFLIGGTIIDDSSQAWAFEDVTPTQVKSFLGKLEENEEVVFDITSPGGSCTAGIAIANLIREASKNGHKTTAHVIGIAASMASVIACACDEIEIDQSAFMMIHNPWTVAQGDSEDLRKSADVLDQIKAAIMSFYTSKFDKTEEELAALMDAETWFTGAEAETFGFKARVIESEGLKAAACAREIPAFANIPESAKAALKLGDHQEVEFQARLANAMKSRDTEINALKAELETVKAEQEKLIAESVDRVSKEFQIKLEGSAKELTEAKAEVTSLTAKLDSTSKELQETASALKVKETALAQLNANVNRPADVKPTLQDARKVLAALPPNQRAAFYAEHKAEIDGIQK